ncbi:YihY/virulence factor BrkB family protein [Gracilimonas tropica]|uniref:YihY/virulence factor BrkB family protein n=1 Tax=Gracilimonas tropica TaxID=454600 RepID=UPI00036B9779|nr:YihY/virulence factor BrkB family protein [Gracilimonas tropica]
MPYLKRVFKVVLTTLNNFTEDNGFLYSAAVSFYTLFSLAPIVMIAVYVSGLFVASESVLSEVARFLTNTIGSESTQAVMLLIETIQADTQNVLFLVISVGFLIISATTVFVQFRNAFNRIFSVKPRQEYNYLKMLMDRLAGFGMILLLGLALMVSLFLDSILAGLSHLFLSNYESAELLLIGIGNNLLTLLLIFLAVLTMFYFLPDVKIRRKALVTGTALTTILLVIGKFGVGMIIGNSSLNQLTGASSSVIILMLWVYYSSIIIFFGIELVKTLAEMWPGEIKAGKYTQKLKLVEIPEQKRSSKE